MNRLLIVITGLLFFSCSGINKTLQQNKCVCVLFDLSLSTQTNQVRDNYMREMNKVIKSIGPGDVLIAAMITGSSISELEFCVQYEFDSFRQSNDNELLNKAERAKFLKQQSTIKDSLVAAINSTLHQNSRIVKTEIMGALQVAARTFRNYKMPRNVLVVFSDMLEDSQFYSFDKENLTPKRIDDIIKKETISKRLPNLQDVKIYIAGASSKDRKRFLAVKSFWLNYFSTCGAMLSEDHYGSILIRFDE